MVERGPIQKGRSPMINLFKKNFQINGWTYKYTKTGIEITNPEGQLVGRPTPLEPSRYDWKHLFRKCEP